ncbi:MAG: hypothetical protein IT428_19110 [Planctomycetaceae bacterium]|nr:hypothetical protein [Planctomycetaceae bacterium]
MTFYRRPRVFISYRHQERVGRPEDDAYNEAHQIWVRRFARDLAAWNVDVLYDVRLRDLFRPWVATDPAMVSYLAEVSLLCASVAHAFMPIITEGYLRRLCLPGAPEGWSEPGTVTQEWRLGEASVEAGLMELVLILREFRIEGLQNLHPLLTPDRAWDFRDRVAANHADLVELLGERLHLGWNVERPTVDLPFAEWISMYVNWCRAEEPGCQSAEIESWGCDFGRLSRFLAQVETLQQEGQMPAADQGTGRHDLDHVFGAAPDALQLVGVSRRNSGRQSRLAQWFGRLIGR